MRLKNFLLIVYIATLLKNPVFAAMMKDTVDGEPGYYITIEDANGNTAGLAYKASEIKNLYDLADTVKHRIAVFEHPPKK
jgi:hypothetical protein